MSLYNYRRRKTSETKVGKVGIGGENPIRVQSMTNRSTMDTEACIRQALEISGAGGELVRLTTQGVREAENMSKIREGLLNEGCDVPLVADVHFNPAAAFKAAETCQKVRINPGNFVDAARTFKKLHYTDEEYAAEILKIRDKLIPFLEICKKNSTAVRLGVNHGSLSDRIMSRYGDTPRGMVESVMEYLRIAREVDFKDIVISIKASNVVVMVETVRLLVKEMDEEGMSFPIHLGVTEAGDGEDGRIKSAVGIGSLLAEGIGDTIRVSLTENPVNEIPVARKLLDHITSRKDHTPIEEPQNISADSKRGRPEQDYLKETDSILFYYRDKGQFPVVVGYDLMLDPEEVHYNKASENPPVYNDNKPVVVESFHINGPGEMAAWIDRFAEKNQNPVILKFHYDVTDPEDLQIKASADLGSLLLKGYGAGILIEAPAINKDTINSIALGILQATRLRISHTEYIACPGCGRTLFDLQKTLAKVKSATSHLTGLKIGVMGCIVNGPGEMADADYGYVGAGSGKVSLYKGKELIKKNIPEEEAIPLLLELIESGHS